MLRGIPSTAAALVAAAASASCTSSSDAPAVARAQDSGGGSVVFPNGWLQQFLGDCGASRDAGGVATSKSDAAREADGRAACTASRKTTYASDVKPIFGLCAGELCHSGTWGSGDPYPFVVGVAADECCDGRQRVAPGDPAGSYVIQKLTGTHLCAGLQMPPGSKLPDADIQTLSDWICLGAPKD